MFRPQFSLRLLFAVQLIAGLLLGFVEGVEWQSIWHPNYADGLIIRLRHDWPTPVVCVMRYERTVLHRGSFFVAGYRREEYRPRWLIEWNDRDGFRFWSVPHARPDS